MDSITQCRKHYHTNLFEVTQKIQMVSLLKNKMTQVLIDVVVVILLVYNIALSCRNK